MKRITKVLTTLGVATALMFGGATAASATETPPPTPEYEVTNFSYFCSGEDEITVTFDYTVSSGTHTFDAALNSQSGGIVGPTDVSDSYSATFDQIADGGVTIEVIVDSVTIDGVTFEYAGECAGEDDSGSKDNPPVNTPLGLGDNATGSQVTNASFGSLWLFAGFAVVFALGFAMVAHRRRGESRS